MDMLDKIPRHVAIIMDGNGRWASMRGLPRIEGHRRGADRAKEVIRAANEAGVEAITLYAFSIENWQRPPGEVSTLMKLLEIYLRSELAELVKLGIRFKAIGDTLMLPENLQSLIRETEERTAGQTGMKLVAALSYSGRNEILRAVKKAIHSRIDMSSINEETFSSLMDTSLLPDPDLIIRTSGEKRLSNFLLWQSAYSEFFFTDTLWPDFTRDEFISALTDYGIRERRFGAVSSG